MADLRNFASAAAAAEHILTKGSGSTPITDGHGNPFFYSEGTWTPIVTGFGNTGEYSATITKNKYVKIGSLVFVQAFIDDITEVVAGSGYIEIRGFPFGVSEDTEGQTVMINNANLPSDTLYLTAELIVNNSRLFLKANFNNVDTDPSAGSRITVQAINSGSTDIHLSLTYPAF